MSILECDRLKEGEIVCAPAGFERDVMKRVREVQKSVHARVCAVWAAAAFLLSIVYFFTADISFDLTSVTEFLDASVENAFEKASGLTIYFAGAQNAISGFFAVVASYDYVFLFAFLLTAALQAVLYRRSVR